jgi:hypothetical protein
VFRVDQKYPATSAQKKARQLAGPFAETLLTELRLADVQPQDQIILRAWRFDG